MEREPYKIWEVNLDVNGYQALYTEDERAEQAESWRFDCLPMARDWIPPPVYSPSPRTSLVQILCYEGLKDPEDEFKPTVERLGVKGMKCRQLWPTTEPEQLF